jgi:hypothetical protein
MVAYFLSEGKETKENIVDSPKASALYHSKIVWAHTHIK